MRMERFVLQMEPVREREGLRCASEDTGALCAVTDGQRKMHLLYANKPDLTPSVSCTFHTHTQNVLCCINLSILLGPVPLTDGLFGRGSGPVHMTFVRCTGDERMLSVCEHVSVLGTVNCHHARDAGVVCTSKN